MKSKILLLVIIFILFSSCKKDDNPVTSGNNSTNPNVIIPPTTKVISNSEYVNNIISVSGDSLQFVFNSGVNVIDNLDSTSVAIMQVGEGILRKVDSVRKNNNTTSVYTHKTSLSKAVQSGTISIYKQLQTSDTSEVILSEGVKMKKSEKSGNVFHFEIEKEYGPAKISGSFDLSLDFKFDVKFDNFTLKECELSSTKVEDVNLTVTFTSGYSIEKEWEVARINFAPITVLVGIPPVLIPVIFTPSIPIKVGLNGSVEAAIQSSATQSNQTTAGIKYKDNQWSPISSESHTFTYQAPALNFSASLEGYIKPSLEIKLYGVVGPYISAKLSTGFEAETDDISIYYFLAFKLGAGVKFEILDLIQVGYWVDDIINKKERWLLTTIGNTGTISGSVKDAITNNPIQNCLISVTKDNNVIGTTNSLSNGNYQVSIPAGSGYKVDFSKAGYLPASYYNVNVIQNQNTVLETILQIDVGHTGIGNISGTIKNALNGQGASGLTLNIRQGINVTSGSILSTTITSSSGSYAFNNIQAGYYTIEASGSGYTTLYFTVISIGGQTTGNQNASITPILSSNEVRIVLTWGATPGDLDAHFTGPLSTGGRFHMYYIYKGTGSPWPNIVTLDVDDVSSYGPETVTLYQQITGGVYRFSVHDYTNRNLTNCYALSNSGAQVKVYKGSTLMATYNVPQNQGGTLWRVFELTDNVLSQLNTFSYVSDPANIDGPAEGKLKFHENNKK